MEIKKLPTSTTEISNCNEINWDNLKKRLDWNLQMVYVCQNANWLVVNIENPATSDS